METSTNFEIMPPPQEVLDRWAQNDTNNAALKYLADTDWYVIRFQETGEPIPEDVTTKRAEARTQIVRGTE